MANRKPIRTRGKLRLSRFFQKFNEGDRVAVIEEISLQSSFPKRLQGRTGVIDGKQGKTYIVNIKDQKKFKNFLIEPIHLKKIKVSN